MMKIFVLLLAIVVACQCQTITNDSSIPQKLTRYLLKDYLKAADPGATDLTFSLSFQCANLKRYNSLELTSRVLESYRWEDSRLEWDPSKFDGLKQLRLPANQIWTPDMKLYNAQEEPEARDDVNVVIYANGTVIWIPTVTYKTFCEPGRDKGDSIVCLLQLGSWTYDADTLRLDTTERAIDMFMYQDTCPYVITDPKVNVESRVYPCCTEKYASIFFRFRIHHRL